MKKTQIIELLKSIKTSYISFISITVFIMLAVAIFTGISWSAGAVLKSVDDIAKDTNMRDLEVAYPYGFDAKDLEALQAEQDIDEVEGAYVAYATFDVDGQHKQAKIMQAGTAMDTAFSVKGKLPEKEDEIALEGEWARENGFKIGDVITFNHDNTGNSRMIAAVYDAEQSGTELDYDGLKEDANKPDMENLVTDKFTVTGLVEIPTYLNVHPNNMGSTPTTHAAVDCVVMVSEKAFDKDSYVGYPIARIRSNSLRDYGTFDDKYQEGVDKFKEAVNPAVAAITADKNSAVKGSVDSAVSDGEKKLAEAKAKIEDAEKQIKVAEKKLANGKKKVKAGEKKLKKAKKQIKKAEKKLKPYKKYVKYIKYVDLAKKEYDKLSPEEKAEIEPYIGQAKKIYKQYKKYLKAKKQVKAGEKKLKKAKAQIKAGEKKLADAKSQLAEGKKEYKEKAAEFASFKESASQVGDMKYSILTRMQNAAIYTTNELSKVLHNLCYSMALLFVIVGLLVCYSSLSRMVGDQLKIIGTKKALGLMRREITLGYLAYAGIALFIGCTLGTILGAIPFQKVLNGSMTVNYVFDTIDLHVTPGPAIIACGAEIVLILGITYFACRKALNNSAVKLLAGPEPPSGKTRFYEKLAIWKRISLLNKTIVNNFFNDGKRVVGTLIGVAGCTALIVTAITMNNLVTDSFKIQFGEINSYDTIVYYDSEVDGAADNIKSAIDDSGAVGAKVIKGRTGLVLPDGTTTQNQIVVPVDVESFNKLVHMRDDNGKVLNKGESFPEGIWLPSAYFNEYGTKAGDEVHIIKDDGTSLKMPIAGSHEFHLVFSLTYIDLATYQQEFGDQEANAFLIDSSKADKDKLISELSSIDGFTSSEDFYKSSSVAFDAFSKISKAMVAMYMVLSIVMAAFVLLNTLMMFVAEKKRELIVLMINGYSVKYARRYIYSDTILLTIVGMFFGLIVGTIMGNYSVSSFESGIVALTHGICWQACAIGVACTSLFALLATLYAMRQIKHFALSDINK